jgi:predicted nucleotidyltransferase component of viral defense system
MNDSYKKQVALLIRIMPSVYKIEDFAVHGGTAINLFHKDMPRYSVDIDITYLPLQEREESLRNINLHLQKLKQLIEKTIPGIKVTHKPDVWKLLCLNDGSIVKIEVNGTKRGIIGSVEDKSLCARAQSEFKMGCIARVVSLSQLYGGKIAAALSRQHPRDLFDYKFMSIDSYAEIKDGLMLALLGSDRPIFESLQPQLIDQSDALQNQFEGMSDQLFSYSDYMAARLDLVENINNNLSQTDKEFFLSFEKGEPDWTKCCAGDLGNYPSVKWKLNNIERLKKNNPKKFIQGLGKLHDFLFKQ